MSTIIEDLTCEQCNRTFKYIKAYKKHISNMDCAHICKICGLGNMSRSTFYRHKNECKLETVNVTTNNIVLLQPFDVDHYFMEKEDVIGSKRDVIVGLIKNSKYQEAYEVLFKHIHGNENLPEHHNIYLSDVDHDSIIVFRGIDFVFEDPEKTLPRLFYRLKYEIKWLVGTCSYLSPKEIDQLKWNVQAHWMDVRAETDTHIRRVLVNNRKVVEKTMRDNVVKTDIKMLKEWKDIKNSIHQGHPKLPSANTVDLSIDTTLGNNPDHVDRLVTLPDL